MEKYSVSEVNELISLADKEPEVQPGNNEQNNASGGSRKQGAGAEMIAGKGI